MIAVISVGILRVWPLSPLNDAVSDSVLTVATVRSMRLWKTWTFCEWCCSALRSAFPSPSSLPCDSFPVQVRSLWLNTQLIDHDAIQSWLNIHLIKIDILNIQMTHIQRWMRWMVWRRCCACSSNIRKTRSSPRAPSSPWPPLPLMVLLRWLLSSE